MNNIVLIGMPAVGKSTIGVLLAKALCCDFCDTDLIIQNKCGMSLCDYIEKNGAAEFLKFEDKTLSALNLKNTVIATGGSAVYGKSTMSHLKESGTTVYLKAPVDILKSRIGNITTRGVVLVHGNTIEEIFDERLPLYEKYADITIDVYKLTPEECVQKIVQLLKK